MEPKVAKLLWKNNRKYLQQEETLAREQKKDEECLLLAIEITEGFLKYEEEELEK